MKKPILTLKQLAPYLPYVLNVMHQSSVIMEMTAHRISGDFLSIHSIVEGFGKPILRPLSDLTKEIEVNGKKFVPIDYFFGENIEMILNAIQIQDVFDLSYSIVQKLFEWHFDVFGLIEQGIAVDINTLNDA